MTVSRIMTAHSTLRVARASPACPMGLQWTAHSTCTARASQIQAWLKEHSPPQAVQRIEQARNPELRWEWAGRTYIKVDGIFSQLISRRGNVSVVRQIGEKKDAYLVTDGNGRWAHGDTIAEARKDLIYKISNRDKSVYESLTLDSELTFEECIQCYRVITGACAAGTRNYVENRLPKPHKEKYTVREMIGLTDGEYNSEKLREFFKK